MMILPIVLAAAIICPELNTTTLVGRWESHNTSKGGIGHVIDFQEDGSYVSSVTVLVNLKYLIEGDSIRVVDPGNPNQLAEPGVKFRIDGDRLIRKQADGPESVAVRVQPAEPGTSGIVGAWSYPHYAGGTAYERYTSDNRLLFRLSMTKSIGCYIPNDAIGEVRLAPLNDEETTAKVHVDSMKMQLVESGREPTRYDKSPWGRWYVLGSVEKNR